MSEVALLEYAWKQLQGPSTVTDPAILYSIDRLFDALVKITQPLPHMEKWQAFIPINTSNHHSNTAIS